jgi:5-formyltetrahydrofolate cyclo-ligase
LKNLTDLHLWKKEQRQTASKHRKTLVCESAALKAAEFFLTYLKPTPDQHVAIFYPLGSEIDTKFLGEKLHALGISVLLPVVTAKETPLTFRKWTSGDPLIRGSFNVLEPADDKKEEIPDILIVPLLAFDGHGFRLGYGGGFYDRTLEKLRADKSCVAVGYAYAGQEIEKVAVGPHDQPLNWIVTEHEARKIL